MGWCCGVWLSLASRSLAVLFALSCAEGSGGFESQVVSICASKLGSVFVTPFRGAPAVGVAPANEQNVAT